MKNFIYLLTLLLLTGCATTYTKLGNTFVGGGYDEIKIQEDTFKVRFYGNEYISTQKVEDFALLRGAEVALQNNYKYFTIVKSDSNVREDSFATIATGYNKARYPDTTILIKCFKDKPEISDTIIYDADQVKTNIKSKYKIK